jgi:hypothetical protein
MTDMHTSQHIKNAVKLGRVSVHLHGWIWLDDGESQEYTDGKADGYCTYVRVKTPDDQQQPFDTSNEIDHETLQSAVESARNMAKCLFDDVEAWNHD